MNVRTKQLAFAAMVLMALSVTGTVGMVISRLAPVAPGKKPAATPTASAPLSPEMMKEAKALQPEVDRLKMQLASLRNPTLSEPTPVNLLVLGFSQRAVESQSEMVHSKSEDFSERVVTMAYVSSSGDERFAVIDDHLYKEGDRLLKMEGATVRTITPHKVLIAGKEVRQWLEVRNPMALDILTKQQEKERQRLAKLGKNEKKSEKAEEGERSSDDSANQLDDALTALKGFSTLLNQTRKITNPSQ
ncbi:MAG: hypothetical protein HQL55_04990 [Magnetococcales bacterium]|nr:hypothetical protein [Magnetococcales bacterium]